METNEKRGEENSRDSASRSGSMDSTNATNPTESLNSSMDMYDDKAGPGHDMQSGRVHKGGRKLIYATLEERKERNRQAQATFRERRIIYVAQLEKTIQEQRDELRRLQNACSSATDERMNLKYKNSLLERILLEKGIEVRAELDAEVPVHFPSKKVRKERQPSIRRSKQTSFCRKHSYLAAERTEIPEICSCHPAPSHGTNSSNLQIMANHSSHHVIESKQPLPPNMVRRQQTHGAQNMVSQAFEPNIVNKRNSVSHLDSFSPLGPDAHYDPYKQLQYQMTTPSSSSDPPFNSMSALPSLPHGFGPLNLAHLDPEWSSSSTTMLRNPDLNDHAYNNNNDEDDDHDRNDINDHAEVDQFASDLFDTTTATHSSPISTVRTPPDFAPAPPLQQREQQFCKQLDDGVAAPHFDLVAAGVESALHAYHAEYGVAQDPFGLDASLFSI